MMKDFAMENGILTGCNPDIVKADIPDGVTAIGKCAFAGCVSLKTVTIPNSVTSIENSVFYRCESLKSITIPNSVTSINIEAFYGCANVVIHCYKNSYAEEYAKEHYIPYKIID